MNSNSKTHDRLGLSGPRSSSTRSSATPISHTLALEHEEKILLQSSRSRKKKIWIRSSKTKFVEEEKEEEEEKE
jgi:hypothetical protein